jgi:hypothetical protein
MIALPDEASLYLAASGRELSRAVIEAVALEGYREGKVSAAQLRRLPGSETHLEVDAVLKEHSRPRTRLRNTQKTGTLAFAGHCVRYNPAELPDPDRCGRPASTVIRTSLCSGGCLE